MGSASQGILLQHEEIKRAIKRRIGRDWKPGDRLPPIDRLAREMGVGETNAYRAVRELSDEGILASRPRRGTIVRSRPAPSLAKSLVRKRVYLPLSPARDAMLQLMARAFIVEMERRGHEVKVGEALPAGNTCDITDIDADAIVLLNEDKERIIWGDGPGPVFAVLNTGNEVPLNLIGRYDVTTSDHEQGAMLAGDCLRRFGIEDPAFLGVTEKSTGEYRLLDAVRLRGFERGFGRKLSSERLFQANAYAITSGADFAHEFSGLKSRPDAVFAVSDELAAGFAIGARALRLVPRRDYLLVGFDGQSLAYLPTLGGVTTVAVPAQAMGRQAAEFLNSRLENPDLPPRSFSLGCTMRRGKTTPRPDRPEYPFWPDKVFWPAAPVQGDSA